MTMRKQKAQLNPHHPPQWSSGYRGNNIPPLKAQKTRKKKKMKNVC